MIKIMFISLVLYKCSKYVFRKHVEWLLVPRLMNNFSNCDMLYRQKRMSAFWNEIKQARLLNKFASIISLDVPERHFTEKFS